VEAFLSRRTAAKQRREYAPAVRRLAALLSLLCVVACGPVAAAGSATTLPGFRSPSGNIACLFRAGHSRNLLCTLRQADYAKSLQARCLAPAGAGVDWHGFALSPTGKALVNCSGGIQYDPAAARWVTVDYGRTWRAGPFTCASNRTGVTCRNGRGHGLFLSRASWRAW
jgi:hypothetical protein